jgi:hypothetical protein
MAADKDSTLAQLSQKSKIKKAVKKKRKEAS